MSLGNLSGMRRRFLYTPLPALMYLYLYLAMEEPGVDLLLVLGEQAHVVKVQHLPVRWPVLDIRVLESRLFVFILLSYFIKMK